MFTAAITAKGGRKEKNLMLSISQKEIVSVSFQKSGEKKNIT